MEEDKAAQGMQVCAAPPVQGAAVGQNASCNTSLVYQVVIPNAGDEMHRFSSC